MACFELANDGGGPEPTKTLFLGRRVGPALEAESKSQLSLDHLCMGPNSLVEAPVRSISGPYIEVLVGEVFVMPQFGLTDVSIRTCRRATWILTRRLPEGEQAGWQLSSDDDLRGWVDLLPCRYDGLGSQGPPGLTRALECNAIGAVTRNSRQGQNPLNGWAV